MVLELRIRICLQFKEMSVYSCPWLSANVDPTLKNRPPESPTFRTIAKFNPIAFQWKGLALEEFGGNFIKYKFTLFWGELTERFKIGN